MRGAVLYGQRGVRFDEVPEGYRVMNDREAIKVLIEC